MERIDDLRWRKSSYSGNGGNCIEVGVGLPGKVAVRDSKDRQGPKLAVSSDAWSEFIEGIKHGELGL
jgi:hypothetical protein